MRFSGFTLLMAVTVVLSARIADASVPSQLSIQGRATDSLGSPLASGSHQFMFRIFDDQLAGSQVWPGNEGEPQAVNIDASGVWSVGIGAIDPLTDAVFAGDVRWLEIIVDGTILPRVQLVTGPYAHRVSTIDGSSGGTITTKLTIGPNHNANGAYTFVAGENNDVLVDYATVGGGSYNFVAGKYGTVSGGLFNISFGNYASIGGGKSNGTGDSASTVAGGEGNLASAEYSAIGGGASNVVNATSHHSTIGGGRLNEITGSQESTIAGGADNLISSSLWGSIAGGYGNEIGPNGHGAMIPGGEACKAIGAYSFAGGFAARPAHTGMFVWSDFASGQPFPNPSDPNLFPGPNFFCCRTTGGAFFATGVNASGHITSSSWLPWGSGTWVAYSDKNGKHAFADVDHSEILQKVRDLPITTWSYNAQGDSVRHIGPMAQDFRAAFGLGESERYISPVDEAGVAFAAIQALAQKLDEKDKQIAELMLRVAELEKQ